MLIIQLLQAQFKKMYVVSLIKKFSRHLKYLTLEVKSFKNDKSSKLKITICNSLMFELN